MGAGQINDADGLALMYGCTSSYSSAILRLAYAAKHRSSSVVHSMRSVSSYRLLGIFPDHEVQEPYGARYSCLITLDYPHKKTYFGRVADVIIVGGSERNSTNAYDIPPNNKRGIERRPCRKADDRGRSICQPPRGTAGSTTRISLVHVLRQRSEKRDQRPKERAKGETGMIRVWLPWRAETKKEKHVEQVVTELISFIPFRWCGGIYQETSTLPWPIELIPIRRQRRDSIPPDMISPLALALALAPLRFGTVQYMRILFAFLFAPGNESVRTTIRLSGRCRVPGGLSGGNDFGMTLTTEREKRKRDVTKPGSHVQKPPAERAAYAGRVRDAMGLGLHTLSFSPRLPRSSPCLILHPRILGREIQITNQRSTRSGF
ncbi:hypothetical protein ACRALDRAFT_209582 [Sodiomyces alcalophilus JCM 7366]|uniref:uncharacterized protein n=1 Tax=Sodiomyces alcalophilus JCM 7366 TaxID=591952 RepID=UPI0039B61245